MFAVKNAFGTALDDTGSLGEAGRTCITMDVGAVTIEEAGVR